MNILLVGNVIKDVYLNLDTRTESFETDKNDTKWLNLSFDASNHHFFNRTTNFGGAAVSLEVLQKLGLEASISNSNLNFSTYSEDSFTNDLPDTDHIDSNLSEPVSAYRYILANEGKAAYFSPSTLTPSEFKIPNMPVDFLYLDRSAKLAPRTTEKILYFLDQNPNTKLIIYIRDLLDESLKPLIDKAALIFLERPTQNPAISDALTSKNTPVKSLKDSSFSVISNALASVNLDPDKLIKISEDRLSYLNISEPLTLDRVDIVTHLSTYSIAAATILGCFVLGFSVENSLKFAKLNLEHSKLNTSLSLTQLKELKNSMNDASNNLELIAKTLVLLPKGILAADESGGSIEKKFAEAGIENSYENRRDYRNLFFTTENLENYVNGVILFDETARQLADNGQSFTDFLTSKHIIPGIKVDGGLEKFDNSEETYTKGLDGLDERLKEYYNMGLRFAKWRAAFNIRFDNNGNMVNPSDYAIYKNCRILAEYAKKCQNAGIVPIVEPEVVHDGDYSVADCAKATSDILDQLFISLREAEVNLKGCLLKTNMVLAGKRSAHPSSPAEVGRETAKVLKEHIPDSLAGVVFLSGGQTVQQATDNLAGITKNGPFPWPVTFSYARALQGPALDAWAGDNNNADKARAAFRARLEANVDAIRQNLQS